MRLSDGDRRTAAKQGSRPVPAPVRRASQQLAEEIGAWRRLQGLTQAQLADRSGIHRTTLIRIEQGDAHVSVENLLRVLRALGILDVMTDALDPYQSDVGRLRADQRLPQRVRPKQLRRESSG